MSDVQDPGRSSRNEPSLLVALAVVVWRYLAQIRSLAKELLEHLLLVY